jgi:ribosomal protein L17
MRTNDNQSQINSYEREVKRLLIKNEELKTTLEKYEELKTLVDLMRKTSNKLL